jgi:hypothetical protein
MFYEVQEITLLRDLMHGMTDHYFSTLHDF